MSKLLVLAMLTVPTVAAADWSVKAPAGWKRASPDTERALVERARKRTGEHVDVEVRQWQATVGDPERQLSGMLTIMPPGVNDESVALLADELATVTASALAPHGFAVQTVKAPKLKGQGSAARVLEGRDLRVFIHTRVRRTAKGAVHLLLVQCGEPAAQARCGKAMSSIKLSVR